MAVAFQEVVLLASEEAPMAWVAATTGAAGRWVAAADTLVCPREQQEDTVVGGERVVVVTVEVMTVVVAGVAAEMAVEEEVAVVAHSAVVARGASRGLTVVSKGLVVAQTVAVDELVAEVDRSACQKAPLEDSWAEEARGVVVMEVE